MVIQSKWFTKLFAIRGAAWFPGIVIVNDKTDKRLVNHEKIHLYQQLELLYIGFLLVYLYYSIFRGYRNHPFEIESWENQYNYNYLDTRKWYSWVKYIKK